MAFLRQVYYSIKKTLKGKSSALATAPANPTEKTIQSKTAYWQEEAWAKRHFKFAGERPHTFSIPILMRVLECLPPKSRILDVGCGHGRYSIPFAEQGHQVVATDVSEEMLGILNNVKGPLEIETRVGDAHHMNAADAEFDVIFSNDFMGHFPDWPVLLKEQARVCKPGGRIIFSLAFKEHRDLASKLPNKKDFLHDYTPEVGAKQPFWAATDHDEIILAGAAAGLTLKALHPLKTFHDSYIVGNVLGTEDNSKFRGEFNERLRDEPKVQEFYNWLELRFLQHLPFYSSNLTLVVFDKTA